MKLLRWKDTIPREEARNAWRWADDTLRIKNSPFGNRFVSALTPWVREPLELFPDNRWREITCQCCVQGGKTQMMSVALAHAMVFAPAPAFFNAQTDDDAKDFADDRFWPMISQLPEIMAKIPKDKSRLSWTKITTPEMFLLIQAANKSNLQSKSIRWTFNDEVHLWKNGLLEQARLRTTQFWNRRIFNGSTAGDAGSEIDQAFEAGDKREWNLACPACGALNLPTWDRIQWPKDASVKQGEAWDYGAIKRATRFECSACKVLLDHTEQNHKAMLAGARYVATNPNPNPMTASFRWNALTLSPSVLSWGDLAVEWLKATVEFDKGNEVPRREFITKRLAESYDPNRFLVFAKLPTIDLVSDWPEEKFRFLTVDVQETEFWVMVEAWSETGDSLVMWCGKVFAWADIEAVRIKWRVQPQVTFVDCGHDARKVYEECVRYGWTALRGTDTKEFTIRAKDGTTRLLPYSWPPGKGDPMMGQRGEGKTKCCPVIRWSNPTIKDIVKRRRDGQARGIKDLAVNGLDEEFNRQMFSERRVSVWDKRTGKETTIWQRIGKRANHLWDCKCMSAVGACLAKIIGEGHE